MAIWGGNIDTKEEFLEGFWWQKKIYVPW
jgi:hypothetical protein